MCGIFLCASTEKPRSPRCLQLEHIRNLPYTCELSESGIAPIVLDHLAVQTALTEQDQAKLDRLPQLRELQKEFQRAKNARKPDLVAEIQLKIEALAVEDSGPALLNDSNIADTIVPEILCRGPNYACYKELKVKNFHFQLLSSVLSLRKPFTKQPVLGPDYILQFNGELYNAECLEKNDTQYISEKINAAILSSNSKKQAFGAVISLLDGEFAYAITDLAENKVYFGKDQVGKRSLLYCVEDDVTISSVFPSRNGQSVTECPGGKMHVVDLETRNLEVIPYLETAEEHSLHTYDSFKPIPGHTGICDDILSARTEQLHEVLSRSTFVRQSTIYPLHPSKEHLDLGVLFSGGLDCTVLAGLIASNYVKHNQSAVIDLLTVGFENTRAELSASESPDRKLSERSWFELSKRFSGTNVVFRLVQVDVLYTDWLCHKKHVLNLIHPRSTEMDLSIAIAFYFACRARDCEALLVVADISTTSWEDFSTNLNSNVQRTGNYTSEARVLFSGLGADELFGGYSRHENIFHDLEQLADDQAISAKYSELSDSLIHDIQIIYERNLGRDDRAMSCWGKELRYPYLDRNVIEFTVNKIEPQLKISFEWADITTKKGTKTVKVYVRKHILRCLARKLGLDMAAEEIKRAIQFGAKSAKLEVGQSKVRGTDAV